MTKIPGGLLQLLHLFSCDTEGLGLAAIGSIWYTEIECAF